MNFEVVYWDQIYHMTYYLFERMKKDGIKPDVIIGVARGGWISARLFADFFCNRKTANLKIEFYDDTSQREAEPIIVQEISEDLNNKTALIVDDISDSGKSLTIAIEHLRNKGASQIFTATLHCKRDSLVIPDYFVRETEAWMVYPWEYAEFILYYYREKHAQNTIQEIKKLLKDIGIPAYLVDSFLLHFISEKKNN